MMQFLRALSCWCGVVAFAFIVAPAFAQVPQDTTFTGRLVDDLGNALAGPVDLELRIFDLETLGNELYSEQHLGTVLDVTGGFSVQLGLGTSRSGTFDADLFSAVGRWLEVVVGGEVMTPRQIIGSVPWALIAQQANEIVPDPSAPPTTRYLSIPSSAFTPQNSADGYTGNDTGTNRTFPDTREVQRMFAPVHLPHEATVQSLWCGGHDMSENSFLRFTLRLNQPQQANVDMAVIETTLPDVGFKFPATFDITSPQVNNKDGGFNYYVVAEAISVQVDGACPSCTVGFCRIAYTVDVPYP
jgi:hypothetical protein